MRVKVKKNVAKFVPLHKQKHRKAGPGPGRPRKGDLVRIHQAVRFDPWVLENLKATAEYQERSLTEVVEEACVGYLRRKGVRRAS